MCTMYNQMYKCTNVQLKARKAGKAKEIKNIIVFYNDDNDCQMWLLVFRTEPLHSLPTNL